MAGMTVLVETSALVAVILQEEGWRELAAKIDSAHEPMTTAVICFEAICAIARQKQLTPSQAHAIVMETIEIAGIAVAGFLPQMLEHAVHARNAYGKGRHPAALNMGDCLSYAAARHYGASLLFKGDDFSQTDMVPA
jgi:ribonuclease VapC